MGKVPPIMKIVMPLGAPRLAVGFPICNTFSLEYNSFSGNVPETVLHGVVCCMINSFNRSVGKRACINARPMTIGAQDFEVSFPGSRGRLPEVKGARFLVNFNHHSWPLTVLNLLNFSIGFVASQFVCDEFVLAIRWSPNGLANASRPWPRSRRRARQPVPQEARTAHHTVKNYKQKRLGAHRVDSMKKLEPRGEIRDPQEATPYRAVAARANYLTRDRSDTAFNTNELCTDSASPARESVQRLKRRVRFLAIAGSSGFSASIMLNPIDNAVST